MHHLDTVIGDKGPQLASTKCLSLKMQLIHENFMPQVYFQSDIFYGITCLYINWSIFDTWHGIGISTIDVCLLRDSKTASSQEPTDTHFYMQLLGCG